MGEELQRNNLARPATVFLSYKREDIEVVKYLQIQLNLRGMRTWLDVIDLPLGTFTRDEIERVIENEADGLVLYVTPALLNSHFVWTVEIPVALRRRERDPDFLIVPILCGVSLANLRQSCSQWQLIGKQFSDLADFHGVHLLEDPAKQSEIEANKTFASVARELLKAALAARLRSIGADHTYELSLGLRNRGEYKLPNVLMDLDLDWSGLLPGKSRVPTTEEWEQVLLLALSDVKDALNAQIHSRRLHLWVQCFLPLALTLGFVFRRSAHFALSVTDQYGVWSSEKEIIETTPLCTFHSSHNNSDPSVAVLEVAVTRGTKCSVAEALTSFNIRPGHHIRLEPPDGPSDKSIKDAAHAQAMACQVKNVCRDFCDRRGVTHIHLFVASTASLAVLIGHQLNALCPISLYEHNEVISKYMFLGILRSE